MKPPNEDPIEEAYLRFYENAMQRVRDSTTVSDGNKKVIFEFIDRCHADGINSYFLLTGRGKTVHRSISNNFEMVIRTHDVELTFPIMRAPKEWFDETKFIVNSSMTSWCKQLTRRTNEKVVLQVHGKRSISVLVKEVWGNCPEANIFEAYRVAEDVVKELIRENQGLVVGKSGRAYIIAAKVSRQSHAIPNDVFATHFIRLNGSFRGRYFEIDESPGTPEIEFVDPKLANEHIYRYIDHIYKVIGVKGMNDVEESDTHTGD